MSGKLLLRLADTIILVLNPAGFIDHILLYHGSGSSA
jgi:hypothetical protein